jgi:Ca2+-binding EF-hand superfamily protein
MGPARAQVLIFSILGLGLAAVLAPQVDLADAPISTGTWALALLSGLINLLPWAYHSAVSTHPKFHILPKRRLTLWVHVSAGVLEILAGFWALASGGALLPARIMALLALLVQVPTSLYQTPIVFGAQIVMWPSYVFAVLLHAFCAVQLLRFPTLFWAMQTFLTLHIYVWVRAFYAGFRTFGLFKDSLYTAACMSAGLMIVPAVLGPAGPLVAFGFVFGYLFLYRVILRPSPAEYKALARELDMEALIDRSVEQLFDDPDVRSEEARAADLNEARQAFLALDPSGSGRVGSTEIAPLLAAWELPPSVMSAFVARQGSGGSFDFDQFYNRVWRLTRLRERTHTLPRAATDRERARLVYAYLDVDGNGKLATFELEALLSEWGLPREDVAACLEKAATRSEDGALFVEFEDFLRKMEPIWQYAYSLLRPDRETEYHRQIARGFEYAVQRARAPRRLRPRTYDTIINRP